MLNFNRYRACLKRHIICQARLSVQNLFDISVVAGEPKKDCGTMRLT